MDLRPSDSQRLLAESARSLLAKRVDQARLDADESDARGYSVELWDELVDLGWTGLLVPELLGGAGSDVLHLGTVLEELGRSAVASPLRACVAEAGLAALRLGDTPAADALGREIAAGEALAVLHAASDTALLARAREIGNDGLVLDAPTRVLEWAGAADTLVVAALLDEERAVLVRVSPHQDGVEVRPAESFDNERVALVTLAGARVGRAARLTERHVERGVLLDALALVAALRATEILGGVRAVLEMTVSYVKDRRQFDRPLGAFQAVRHRCADMATEVDALWLLTSEALWRASAGLPYRRAAAAAAVFAARAAERVLMGGSQLHGGIGFMSEFRLHWYYRRLKAQQLRLGSLSELMGWTGDELLEVGRSLAPYAEVGTEGAYG
jgi:alkylation response protein AidB-like acyl-CoA dehydrogenase